MSVRGNRQLATHQKHLRPATHRLTHLRLAHLRLAKHPRRVEHRRLAKLLRLAKILRLASLPSKLRQLGKMQTVNLQQSRKHQPTLRTTRLMDREAAPRTRARTKKIVGERVPELRRAQVQPVRLGQVPQPVPREQVEAELRAVPEQEVAALPALEVQVEARVAPVEVRALGAAVRVALGEARVRAAVAQADLEDRAQEGLDRPFNVRRHRCNARPNLRSHPVLRARQAPRSPRNRPVKYNRHNNQRPRALNRQTRSRLRTIPRQKKTSPHRGNSAGCDCFAWGSRQKLAIHMVPAKKTGSSIVTSRSWTRSRTWK